MAVPFDSVQMVLKLNLHQKKTPKTKKNIPQMNLVVGIELLTSEDSIALTLLSRFCIVWPCFSLEK